MDKIDEMRIQVNHIDEKIMSLLDQRYRITNKIGVFKKESTIRVLDTNRENYIMNKVGKYSHSPQIGIVYETIMSESKKAQRR